MSFFVQVGVVPGLSEQRLRKPSSRLRALLGHFALIVLSITSYELPPSAFGWLAVEHLIGSHLHLAPEVLVVPGLVVC